MKVALFVLTYLLAGCDLLPYVSRIPFLKLWDFVLKALRKPNLFTAPIFTEEDGILRVDIDESVKLPAAMFFSRVENASAQIATDPGLLFATGGWDLGPYVNKIRLNITTVHGHMPSRCCPDLDACRKHVSKSDAVFEHWGGRFQKKMPTVDFNGRGWVVEPQQTHHKRGIKLESRRAGALTRDNIVMYLSSRIYVDGSGNVWTLRCSCNPAKAPQRDHRCKKCRCLGNCTLSCGCQDRCLLPPPSSGATEATSSGDADSRNGGARELSIFARGGSAANRGRRGSTANRGRRGSTAYRGRTKASRATNASRAAVSVRHSDEPRRFGGGSVVGEGWGLGISPNSCYCRDGGHEDYNSVGSRSAAGIWTAYSDLECSGSETDDSATEAKSKSTTVHSRKPQVFGRPLLTKTCVMVEFALHCAQTRFCTEKVNLHWLRTCTLFSSFSTRNHLVPNFRTLYRLQKMDATHRRPGLAYNRFTSLFVAEKRSICKSFERLLLLNHSLEEQKKSLQALHHAGTFPKSLTIQPAISRLRAELPYIDGGRAYEQMLADVDAANKKFRETSTGDLGREAALVRKEISKLLSAEEIQCRVDTAVGI
ncbi:unnamed protein product, partial [Sphacelaria rigidula]